MGVMFDPQGPTLFELARQALSSTERGYDLLAPKFDHTPFRTPDTVLQAVERHLAAGPAIGRGLDLCCGTGAGAEVLRRAGAGLVAGVDVSAGMLEVARRKPGGADVGWVRADAMALPFGPVFDVVVCLGALGHVLPEDQPRFIAEVARVLRPGGRFVFVTSYPPGVASPQFWMAHGFNAAMRVRNALISPQFVMYYLTFLLPEVRRQLEEAGLVVEEAPLGRLRIVTATRPS
jgi:ubiquinone/menaquinone biosynthesis C-methylase UbiE